MSLFTALTSKLLTARDSQPTPLPLSDLTEAKAGFTLYDSAAITSENVMRTFAAAWKGTGWPMYDDMAGSVGSRLSMGIESAWADAFEANGMTRADMTMAEQLMMRSAMARVIEQARATLPDYFATIWAGARKDPPEPSEASVMARARLWINQRAMAYAEAVAMIKADEPLEWTLGQAEHCPSCVALAGRVKRGSFWHDHGIMPRVPGAEYLNCRGYNCQCDLVPTTKPLSKGPLPRLP